MATILTAPKVLLFIKTPPPNTGATLINKYIAESPLLNSEYIIKNIEIHFQKKNTGFGKIDLSKLLIIIRLTFRLAKELLFLRPKLVYFQISPVGIAWLRDFIYVLIIKAFGIRILYHLHGIGIKEIILKKPLIKPLYRLAFRNNHIICLSTLVASDIEGLYHSPPYIVHNGIKPSILGFPNKDSKNTLPVILFLSNLIRFKGLEDFLDSLFILNLKGMAFSAKIIGEESDIRVPELLKMISDKNLDGKVKYLGPKYNDEKSNELLSSDIFVYPTRYDAWGLAVVEAMEAKLPVIATNEGSLPLIIKDGFTGFLVEKYSPIEIAEKLEVLINNPELREKMGEAGRKRYLEMFTYDIFEKNMLTVFKSVLLKK
jgi:glycosyltransferase involved in cell wall biosynthesis